MTKLFLAITILFSINGEAQLRNLRFDKLSVENGLPERFASCSLEDHLGYIWIGTQNGLVRYDGYEVKVYKLETENKKVRTLCIIESLFEDKKGNIWIGTYLHGLFRYNRLKDNFSVFSHGTPQSPAQRNDLVWQITEDKNGFIWTMSSTGFQERNHLDKIDPGSGTLISFDSTGKDTSNISKETINALFSDAGGSIWLAANSGLFKYDETTTKFHRYLAGKEIRYIYEAPSLPGILWLSTWNANGAKGLTRFNSTDQTSIGYNHSVSQNNSLNNDSIFCVFEDHQKKIWIGTASGLSLLDPVAQTFTSYMPSDKNAEADANNCHEIKEDKNGALWIRSGKGMLYLSPEKFKLQRFIADQHERDALPVNTLYNSLIDRNNMLWLGTYGHGILRLNEQKSSFEFIHSTGREKSYPGGAATGFALLKDGTYLVSTTRGLFHCNASFKDFKSIPLVQNIKSELPTQNITVDRDGIAWIGTAGNGLFSFNPVTNKIKQYVNKKRDSTSLSSDIIRLVFEDRRGRLWVGTGGGGLCLLNKNTGKFLRLPFVFNAGDAAAHGALDDNEVSSLFEDGDGILWVGTNKGGLNRYNEKENNFTSHYDTENGVASVTDIKEDRAGRLWLGTYLSGLLLFDRKKNSFKRFTEKDGLVFDNVESITEDRSGKLWIASGRGYSIIDPVTFQITQLTSANGLPDNKLTRSNLLLPDDTWIVGTAEGIIRFQPGTLTINPVPPVVHVQKISYAKQGKNNSIETSVLINDQKQLVLAYNENRVSFQYVGLHYNNPALNQYSYQLIGYDKDWISAGNLRTITYTNLSPGTYTFQVKASNSDGVWSKKFAAFTLIITPPWWQTSLAYTLYLLALVSLIWAIVIYRSRALKRENKLLEEKVEDRTVQLKKSFENLKATQTQLIQSEKMASLGELTAGIAHEIQNPLNFVNNFSEVNKELTIELEEELKRGNLDDVQSIAKDIRDNEEKINYHGRRADAIVKNMLQHSRSASGNKEPVDINALADEYLRLAYHGFRARDKNFNASLNSSFDPSIGNINVVPQDIGRVLLNLFNNAFYAVAERSKAEPHFEPAVNVSTKKRDGVIEISVKDNGAGIVQNVADKIFQPFFTTKPTGQGTGLGLSLSYDIIKAHGGEINVNNRPGEGAEFIISLPG